MVLTLNHITKYYGGREIFSDVDCKIDKGDKIGLIGKNGCGKTTMLNIIAKGDRVDNGEVILTKGVTLGFLAQDSGLDSKNTIIEEMRLVFCDLIERGKKLDDLREKMVKVDENSDDYNRILEEYSKLSTRFEAEDGYNIDYKIKRVLNGFGFMEKDMETPVCTLSGGEKTRLAFCKLLLAAPDLLVLDEPTNHLDVDTLFWLEEYLKEYKGAVLIVSHDRYFLDKVVDRIWEIELGKLHVYKGNYTKFLQLKDEHITRQLKEYERQQTTIASYEEFIQKNIARASTSKSAKSRVHALENMEIIEKPAVDSKRAKLRFELDMQSGFDVLSVRDVQIGFGESVLATDVNMDVKRGEFIALLGKNGAGKSTLLKCLMGKEKPIKGVITFGKNVKVGYYDQEHLSLNKNNTVLTEVWNRFPRFNEQQIRNILGAVLVSGEDVYKKIGVLSGGEKAKVLFAILNLERPNVLLLDEPTNHLDITTKEVVEEALSHYEGTVITVSHDRYFISKLFNKIASISGGRFMCYEGGYDDYVKAVSAQVTEEKTVENIEKTVAGGYRTREQKKQEAKDRQKISIIENELTEIDEQIAFIESEMAKEDIYSDYEKMEKLCHELEETKKKQEKNYELWSKLMEAIDE